MATLFKPAPAKTRPELVWTRSGAGGWVATVVTMRGYRTAAVYEDREVFAFVRPGSAAHGLVFSDLGGSYVVSRTTFSDLVSFDDLETAKHHVEALFALECAG